MTNYDKNHQTDTAKSAPWTSNGGLLVWAIPHGVVIVAEAAFAAGQWFDAHTYKVHAVEFPQILHIHLSISTYIYLYLPISTYLSIYLSVYLNLSESI